MLEYLEPFNCVQTIVILVSKQISSDYLKVLVQSPVVEITIYAADKT